jgi:integrase/recombinase XerD
MGKRKNIVIVTAAYQELARHYYKHLQKLGYHPESSKSRHGYLCEFLNWLEHQGRTEIEKLSSTDIVHYYNYISERPSKKGGTLNSNTTKHHMRNIKHLLMMLQNENRITNNPYSSFNIKYPQEENTVRNILTQEEIKQLYQVTATAQERAILSLAYGCGLRVGELVACNIVDIRIREKIIIVPKGKGNKRRVIPMSTGVVKDVSDYYYNEREGIIKNHTEIAFMVHSRGQRMQKYTYNKYLRNIIERTESKTIKDKEITIHNLRHSIATHLLEQGISVEKVRLFLGHKQLETTQIYTHISKEQLKELIQ